MIYYSAQLDQLYNSTLAAVICRNSDAVEYSQPFVMRKIGANNEIVSCSRLDTFDFTPWQSRGTDTAINAKVKVNYETSNVRSFKTKDKDIVDTAIKPKL